MEEKKKKDLVIGGRQSVSYFVIYACECENMCLTLIT